MSTLRKVGKRWGVRAPHEHARVTSSFRLKDERHICPRRAIDMDSGEICINADLDCQILPSYRFLPKLPTRPYPPAISVLLMLNAVVARRSSVYGPISVSGLSNAFFNYLDLMCYCAQEPQVKPVETEIPPVREQPQRLEILRPVPISWSDQARLCLEVLSSSVVSIFLSLLGGSNSVSLRRALLLTASKGLRPLKRSTRARCISAFSSPCTELADPHFQNDVGPAEVPEDQRHTDTTSNDFSAQDAIRIASATVRRSPLSFLSC